MNEIIRPSPPLSQRHSHLTPFTLTDYKNMSKRTADILDPLADGPHGLILRDR